MNALLEFRNVSKRYGAIHALENVDFALVPGEVVGLMGDNGAGKSTLVKLIAGNFQPSEGQILLGGEETRFADSLDARQRGIEAVYQDLALCDNLTAADNVFLGRELKWRFGPFRFLDYGAMARRAGELFAELQSETRPRDVVRMMSGGQRQAVAIARTRLADARLVLMDEPTAAISVRQVTQVLALIERLRAQGVTVLLISHRMPDVFAVADRLVVLRRGRKVADKPIARDLAGGGDGADHGGDCRGLRDAMSPGPDKRGACGVARSGRPEQACGGRGGRRGDRLAEIAARLPRACRGQAGAVAGQPKASGSDALRRSTKSRSASARPGSSGGASYSPSILWTRALASCIESRPPASDQVSKGR